MSRAKKLRINFLEEEIHWYHRRVVKTMHTAIEWQERAAYSRFLRAKQTALEFADEYTTEAYEYTVKLGSLGKKLLDLVTEDEL